jgi:sugar transferase (PEP-CTERM system associated)
MRILGLHVKASHLLFGAAETLVLLACPYLVHLFVYVTPAEFNDLFPEAVTFSVVLSASMLAMGVHKSWLREGFASMMLRTALAFFLIGALPLAAFYFFLGESWVPPTTFALWMAFSFVLVGLLRWTGNSLLDRDFFKSRTLVLGCGRNASLIFTRMRRKADRSGFIINGFVDDCGTPNLVAAFGGHAVHLDGSLLEYCIAHRVDEIVVAADECRRLDRGGDPLPLDALLDCRLRGIRVTDIHGFIERETGRVEPDLMRPSRVIFADGFPTGPLGKLMHRLFDVSLSLLLLVIAAPVMLLVAFAIKLEDGLVAPVLYRQTRVGRDNRLFELIKFRSMKVDAEDSGRAVWAQMNDSRVTRVGRFIRTSRLDELPQLINILRGEMRFVGPRPERPEFVAMLEQKFPHFRLRRLIKPGLTGWAQLRCAYAASEADAETKLQYDLYYMKNRSWLLDLLIILQTVGVMLLGRGAR